MSGGVEGGRGGAGLSGQRGIKSRSALPLKKKYTLGTPFFFPNRRAWISAAVLYGRRGLGPAKQVRGGEGGRGQDMAYME